MSESIQKKDDLLNASPPPISSNAPSDDRKIWMSIPGHLIEEVQPEEMNWVFPRLEIADDGTVASVELYQISEEAEPQSNLDTPAINLRFIEPEDVAPACANANQPIHFQAKPGPTAEEIHEAIQATLEAPSPEAN